MHDYTVSGTRLDKHNLKLKFVNKHHYHFNKSKEKKVKTINMLLNKVRQGYKQALIPIDRIFN